MDWKFVDHIPFATGATWTLPVVGLTPALLSKLSRFRNFQDGWAFGTGRAFSQKVIDDTTALLSAGLITGTTKFTAIDVFPGRYGQLVASFYIGDDEYDFEVRPDGIFYRAEVGGVESEPDEALTLQAAMESVFSLGFATWHSSYSYSKTTTTTISDDFAAKPSSPTMIFQGSQYLIETALSKYRVASARMPVSTTGRRYPQGPQTFIHGTSTGISYQTGSPWKIPPAIAEIPAIKRLAG
jgi:hypothetical protein